MTTKINISIPQPCHENWQEMTAMDKGRFCNSCQKKVFDFTSSSDREIINSFKKNNNLCGRFLDTQLNRDLVKPKEKNSLWLATTTALISLIGLNEVAAQETPKTEQTDKKVLDNSVKTENDEIEISGVVSDSDGFVPGANIHIKGKSTRTQTDFDGKFSIKAINGDVLVTSYVGYNDTETKIINQNNIEIKINSNNLFMGEIFVGGAYRQKKRTFFGRIFHSIGSWFR